MTFLKTNWLTLLVLVVLIVFILVEVFHKNNDPAAVVKSQMEALRKEMKDVILHEFDSIQKVVASPIPLDYQHSDSLQQIAIDLNNKTLYELRKKNERRLDTISAADLKSIFAEYGRQHPMSSN